MRSLYSFYTKTLSYTSCSITHKFLHNVGTSCEFADVSFTNFNSCLDGFWVANTQVLHLIFHGFAAKLIIAWYVLLVNWMLIILICFTSYFKSPSPFSRSCPPMSICKDQDTPFIQWSRPPGFSKYSDPSRPPLISRSDPSRPLIVRGRSTIGKPDNDLLCNRLDRGRLFSRR